MLWGDIAERMHYNGGGRYDCVLAAALLLRGHYDLYNIPQKPSMNISLRATDGLDNLWS